MNWLFSHPYVSAILTAFALVVIGLLVISTRSDVGPRAGETRTWGTLAVDLTDPLGAVTRSQGSQENLYTQTDTNVPLPFIQPSVAEEGGGDSASGEFDFDAFLATLTKPKTTTTAQTSGTGLEEAYSLIPSGMISTSTWGSRTPRQSAIYNYGNEAGGYILSYDNNYRHAPQILKDQFEDRDDPAKNARLMELADAMIGVGRSLQGIEPMPTGFRSANSALGQSYIDMGTKLKVIATAKTDDTLLDGIVEYNAAVEDFTKKYVALATLFSAYGVTFTSDEEGSVFVFTNAPSL